MSYHVPEHLRCQLGPPYTTSPGMPFGHFLLRLPGGRALLCMATDGVDDLGASPESVGWEHVSVSVPARGGPTRPRLPTWQEMCQVKALFWDPEDVVVQFHPRESEYVNHAEVLHLWRYTIAAFPTPAPILVGPTK